MQLTSPDWPVRCCRTWGSAVSLACSVAMLSRCDTRMRRALATYQGLPSLLEQAIGRRVAVAVGLLFMTLQVLQFTDVVTVNWSVVHRAILTRLDVSHDG